MSDLLTHQKAKGALSEDVTSSDFYVWWMKQPASKGKGWLGSPLRTDARDRIYERYLKSKAVGPNGVAFLLSGRFFSLNSMYPDMDLRGFYEVIKAEFPSPLAVLIDLVKDAGIPVKDLRDEITGEHIDQTEEAIKIFIRIKNGGKRTPLACEGVYHDTSPGHSKFWSLTYVGENTYRATWGKIGGSVQGHKDYTQAEAFDLAHKKTHQGNYIKQ